jgi:hypothetical protein
MFPLIRNFLTVAGVVVLAGGCAPQSLSGSAELDNSSGPDGSAVSYLSRLPIYQNLKSNSIAFNGQINSTAEVILAIYNKEQAKSPDSPLELCGQSSALRCEPAVKLYLNYLYSSPALATKAVEKSKQDGLWSKLVKTVGTSTAQRQSRGELLAQAYIAALTVKIVDFEETSQAKTTAPVKIAGAGSRSNAPADGVLEVRPAAEFLKQIEIYKQLASNGINVTNQINMTAKEVVFGIHAQTIKQDKSLEQSYRDCYQSTNRPSKNAACINALRAYEDLISPGLTSADANSLDTAEALVESQYKNYESFLADLYIRAVHTATVAAAMKVAKETAAQ